ncbi:helicase-related protein [Shigella boydii]
MENIQKAAERLAELVPEARIAIGHGQMRERELERVMNDFHHQRCDVLVCTTIIETGIDIPTADTIIIERADHFGLASCTSYAVASTFTSSGICIATYAASKSDDYRCTKTS